MGTFATQLQRSARPVNGRRWVYVPYDQLSADLGALGREAPGDVGIVLVESAAKADRRPYHQQKLALVLANQRHFALEQQARGVAVRYVFHDDGHAAALRQVAGELGALDVMRPAERELRAELAPLVAFGLLREVRHEGWLTTSKDFEDGAGAEPPWRLDAFYKHVRLATGILMDGPHPRGGRFSHDADNRQPWRGAPPAPSPPSFPVDDIKREVADLVAARFAQHPGALHLPSLPATLDDAERAWAFARASCLPHFGPYEDAMSAASDTLFHTLLSPLLNLHRITPRRVLDDVVALDLPLASQEGFVRQLLGWREFVHHVHERTDGFRTLDADGAPNLLNARQPLPPAFWPGARSGLACLDNVVDQVWKTGHAHHIQRLMVLSNIATLLDVEPRALTDWFWVGFVDAYDWVVEPNVLAMGTYATGALMTTKPYISGASYIHKMSDYCRGCAFHPKRDCPVTHLYWAFLERHRAHLDDNHRMRMPMAAARKRHPDDKRHDARVYDAVTRKLARGLPIVPDDVDTR